MRLCWPVAAQRAVRSVNSPPHRWQGWPDLAFRGGPRMDWPPCNPESTSFALLRACGDGEPACRRGSVPRSPCGGRGGGHPSVRSTWGDRPDRPSHVRPCSGWGLPSRRGRPRRWCALTAPFHPCLCPVARAIGGLLSVALNRQVTPSWLTPAPCPSEPRPSSTWSRHAAATRPAHRHRRVYGNAEGADPEGSAPLAHGEARCWRRLRGEHRAVDVGERVVAGEEPAHVREDVHG